MNFWKTFIYRWDEEELRKWTSLKRTAYLLLPLLVYFAVHDMAEILLWIPLRMLSAAGGGKVLSFLGQYEYTLQGILYGIATLIGVGAIWSAVKGEICALKTPGNRNVGKKWIHEKKVTAYAFLAAFAFCVAVSFNIFFELAGLTGGSQGYSEVHQMQYGVQFAVGLVLYGIISPLAEEAVFRGLLYNRMKRCFHYGIALVVSSLLFGIYHGNLVQAVYGSILGLMIAYFYDQYESFAAPVLFHGMANVSIYAMTYRNRLAGMSRTIALIMGTISFAAAVMIFFYIKKKCMGEIKKD